MDKFSLLKQKYEFTMQLQNEQLLLDLHPEEESVLEQLNLLEEQIQSTFAEIEALNISVEVDLSSNERAELMLVVEKLISNNMLIKNKIEQLYSDASATMNQVSRHKKTLTSYGGASQYDEVAYYFDEKR